MLKAVYLLLIALTFSFCSAQFDPATTYVNFNPSTPTVVAGNQLLIQIQPRTSDGQPISDCSLGTTPFNAFSDPPLATFSLQSCKSGTFPYTITMIADKKDIYQVTIYYQNTSNVVGQSPYQVTYIAGDIYAQNSFIFGPGTHSATAGIPAFFGIQTYDQLNNSITICISDYKQQFVVTLVQSGGPVQGLVNSCDIGIYNASYTPFIVDQSVLTVTYQTTSLKNTPAYPTINPGPPFGPNCVLNTNGKIVVAGEVQEFSLVCLDEYKNPVTYDNCSSSVLDNYVVEFVSDTGVTKTASRVSCNELLGLVTFAYNLTLVGNYDADIYFIQPDPNALFPSFNVTVEHANSSSIVAKGPGVTDNVTSNIAGELVPFYITASDVYGNEILECFTEGVWNFTVDHPMNQPPTTPTCDNTTQMMQTSWMTTNAKTGYKISVFYTILNQTLSGVGQPYRTKVFANVLNGSQSTISQQTDVANAGVEYIFSVDGKDSFDNPINNCSYSVDTTLFIAYIENYDNSTSYNVTFVCNQLEDYKVDILGYVVGQKSGRYHLYVSYNGSLLLNAPKNLTINPGAMVPNNTIAIGTGFFNHSDANVIAGQQFNFTVQPRDQYNNIITDCLSTKNYTWNVIAGPIEPFSVKVNQTFNNCDNHTGSYFKNLVFTTRANEYFIIKIYSVIDDDFRDAMPINNTGMVYLQPADFDTGHSSVNVAPIGIRGQNVSVFVDPHDKYGNKILNCTVNPSLFVIIATNGPETVFGTSLNCNPGILEGLYGGSFLADTIGIYMINVTYINELVGSPNSTKIEYGTLDPGNTFANGTGVGVCITPPCSITAGSNAIFWIVVNNQYNYPVPAYLIPKDGFNINYRGLTNNNVSVITLDDIDNSSTSNLIIVSYNATIAQQYQINILYNNEYIQGSYTSTVVAGPLDPGTLQIHNLTNSNGQGSFWLSGTDAFDNPVPLDQNSGIIISLSPACALNQSISCEADGSTDSYICSYTVSQGGIYCVTVISNITHQAFAVADSSFEVIGGTACENSCSNNGYCFLNNNDNYECNCINGYTGSDCSDKISKNYMKMGLGIGLIVGVPIALLIIGLVLGCVAGRAINRDMSINR